MIIINVNISSYKVPVTFSMSQLNFSFLDRFSKKILISNFKVIRLVGAEFFHADGQT